MSSQTTTHAAKAPAKGAAKASSGTYISLMALVMMNVTIIGSVANDVQQAYYGLSSVTLFIIGALVFFLPTGLVAAELASGWGQRGGIFRWVGEALGWHLRACSFCGSRPPSTSVWALPRHRPPSASTRLIGTGPCSS